MFLYSLIEELCTKEENGKKGRNFNFGRECTSIFNFWIIKNLLLRFKRIIIIKKSVTNILHLSNFCLNLISYSPILLFISKYKTKQKMLLSG